MAAIEAHERELFTRLYDGLSARDDITLLGSPSRRTPTVGFTVDDDDLVELQTVRDTVEYVLARMGASGRDG